MSTSVKSSGTKQAFISLVGQRIENKIRVRLEQWARKLQSESDKLSTKQRKVILILVTSFWIGICVLIIVFSLIDTGKFTLSITPVQTRGTNNLNIPKNVITSPALPCYHDTTVAPTSIYPIPSIRTKIGT